MASSFSPSSYDPTRYRVQGIEQGMEKDGQHDHHFGASKQHKDDRSLIIFKKTFEELANQTAQFSAYTTHFTVTLEELKKQVYLLEYQIQMLNAFRSKNLFWQSKQPEGLFARLFSNLLLKKKNFSYHKIYKRTLACQKDLNLNLIMLKNNLLCLAKEKTSSAGFLEKKRLLLNRIEKLIRMNRRPF